MVDLEESKLKAEIDEIIKNINKAMKKIEREVPLKTAPAEQPAKEQVRKSPTAENS